MQRLGTVFFELSLVCAVLATGLVSLDECPWWPISYFPARPSYLVALAGVGCWLLSGRWHRGIGRHKTLLFLVLAALVWSTFATVWGSLARKPGHIVFDYLFFFLNWRVWPLVFLVFIALAFAGCSRERTERFLSWGLIVLFVPNAVHGLLEIAANCGWADVKTFLSNGNHLFRKEKVAHGWWPPVFFEGRVRGLFAEPSHMAFSLLPLFGFFAAKLRKSRLYWLPIALLLALYGFGKTDSGCIGIGAFCFFFVACHPALSRKTRLTLAGGLLVLGLAAIAFGVLWFQRTGAADIALVQLRNSERLSAYCREVHDGRRPDLPRLDDTRRAPSSFFSRLTAMRLDLDAAWQSPLVGVGFFQKGFYWEPLAACDIRQSEFGLWVAQAMASPFRGVPQIAEYTTLAAEFGFPGLVAFLALYVYIAVRAMRFARQADDRLLYGLTCAYLAMLVDAFFISLINAVLFFFLAGFLYALSTPRAQARRLDGSGDCL